MSSAAPGTTPQTPSTTLPLIALRVPGPVLRLFMQPALPPPRGQEQPPARTYWPASHCGAADVPFALGCVTTVHAPGAPLRSPAARAGATSGQNLLACIPPGAADVPLALGGVSTCSRPRRSPAFPRRPGWSNLRPELTGSHPTWRRRCTTRPRRRHTCSRPRRSPAFPRRPGWSNLRPELTGSHPTWRRRCATRPRRRQHPFTPPRSPPRGLEQPPARTYWPASQMVAPM